jgi:hypothetical protein
MMWCECLKDVEMLKLGCLEIPENDDKVISTSGNFWYINNCLRCGKYIKKPLRKDNYSTEYFCPSFKAFSQPNDYRCLNTGDSSRHSKWGKI